MTKEYIALSCVSIGTGQGDTTAMLARVSMVDLWGNVVYDAFIRPTSPIESFRAVTTGLNATYPTNALPFAEVQLAVAGWISGKIVVGHQLWLDLQVLGISHPAADTRDVGLFLPFRAALRRPDDAISLPTLVHHLMRRKIQEVLVDSLENARAALDLYRSFQVEWEDFVTNGEWPCALPPAAFNHCYI